MPTAPFLWRIELRVPSQTIPHFEQAHRHCGLKLIDTITVDGWQTLLMAR